jgi:hypothetical protein
MNQLTTNRPDFSLNPVSIELALVGAMAAVSANNSLDIHFDYEPGQLLSVDLSVSGHFLSGDTPEGRLSFDLGRGVDIDFVWEHFERELVAIHIRYFGFEPDLFE